MVQRPGERGKPHLYSPTSCILLSETENRTISCSLDGIEIQSLLTEFSPTLLIHASAVTEEEEPTSPFGGSAVEFCTFWSRFLRSTTKCMMTLTPPLLKWPFYPSYWIQPNPIKKQLRFFMSAARQLITKFWKSEAPLHKWIDMLNDAMLMEEMQAREGDTWDKHLKLWYIWLHYLSSDKTPEQT